MREVRYGVVVLVPVVSPGLVTGSFALPEGGREVLLRYWYDFSGRDAASVLGCATAAFAVRLYRAHRRFKAVREEQPAAQQSPSVARLTAHMRGLQ